VDLPYDSYLKFLALLQPLFQAFASRFTGKTGLSFGASMAPVELVTTCAEVLPELACIVCEQTDPLITVEEVKKLGNPLKLASLVVTQIKFNRMIQDIADFFVQILPLMEKPAQEPTKKSQARTKKTPSQ